MTKALVYRGHVVIGHDPRVLSLFPSARQTSSGAIVVPHGVDEVRLLRNLNYQVDAPILHEYNWSGAKPFDSQRVTAAHITMHQRSFVLNGMGTGKTRALLFAYDYLRAKGLVSKLLVIAPLSTLRPTWMREISLVFPHLRAAVLHGSRTKRLTALALDADIYLINYDGIEVIKPELVARHVDMVCVDETTAYKTKSSDRWKHAAEVLRGAKWVAGMTGTPTPQSPLDAYRQIMLIVPERAKRSFVAFRDDCMLKVGMYKWVPKRGAEDYVLGCMQPAVRFKRSDCFDLPPVVYVDRFAALSREQAAAYKTMAEDCVLSCARGEVTAMNEADKINKLLQIALGVVYTKDKREQQLAPAERLKVLAEVVEQAESKVLVFTPYKSTLRMLHAELSKRWVCAEVSGDTTASQRDTIFSDFQGKDTPHVIVAHPQCMAHGLNLVAASTVVWYGPTMSLELYEQANARITRSGQTRTQLVVHLVSTKVEERIYARLRARAKVQGLLLSMFEQQEIADQV